ncbi:MAG: FliH/SctL family protein [Phycisphaerales bacterium]|jgi:flagellar biosynthesis/type III secretory pathway protein FliH
MSQTLTVHFEKPIASAKILDNNGVVEDKLSVGGGVAASAGIEQALTQEVEAQKTAFLQTCQALNAVIAKLNEFCDKLFVEHKDEIAKLSVEIARKVLMQKVEDGDYEIESVIKEALKNAPTREDIVVHLNPDDLTQCQKAQKDEPDSELAGIKFVSDSKIGRAECLLESPKGVITSLIDEHLERVSKALQKAG